MEKSGKDSSCELFTFKYPGREPKYIEEFFAQRPDVRGLYVYDLNLTTGKLLYSCAGGIGVSKERNMVEMHNFISKKYSSTLLKETFRTIFGDKFSLQKYIRLRTRFNDKPNKTHSSRDCAELYCLWAATNFSHRYIMSAYDGHFLPARLNYDGVDMASRISRSKEIKFRKESLSSFSESVINSNTVLYMHFPEEYRNYGCGFRWNSKMLEYYVSSCNELHSLGYKVCVSAEYVRRGLVLKDYPAMFPEFEYVEASPFKSIRSEVHKRSSEIYLMNF